MLELRQSTNEPHAALSDLVKGISVGMIAIVAIAVWASNFEDVAMGRVSGGLIGFAFRLFICEAIPLATLCVIFRGLSRNHSAEEIFRSILKAILWCCGGAFFKCAFKNSR